MRVLEWGDGEYAFDLPGKCVNELQKVCGDVGLGNIAARMADGNWKYDEIRHTIRLGLIGGGMGAVEANRLVNMYIPAEGQIKVPLVGPNSAVLLANVILNDVMMCFKDMPGTEKKTPTPTDT